MDFYLLNVNWVQRQTQLHSYVVGEGLSMNESHKCGDTCTCLSSKLKLCIHKSPGFPITDYVFHWRRLKVFSPSLQSKLIKVPAKPFDLALLAVLALPPTLIIKSPCSALWVHFIIADAATAPVGGQVHTTDMACAHFTLAKDVVGCNPMLLAND